MHAKENDFETLADRVRHGDRKAEATLHRQLEPVMVGHVLQALSSGEGTNPMASGPPIRTGLPEEPEPDGKDPDAERLPS